jgi:conjugal transfer pilus assembly protein TraV
MRKKPDVLRVWISPWESKDNDLHMPGYVYTEIDDSRWLVGEQVYRHGGNITPLSIRKPKSESDASDQKSGQNKSGQMYPGSK